MKGYFSINDAFTEENRESLNRDFQLRSNLQDKRDTRYPEDDLRAMIRCSVNMYLLNRDIVTTLKHARTWQVETFDSNWPRRGNGSSAKVRRTNP